MKVIDDIFDNLELDYIRSQFYDSLKGNWQINKYHWQDLLHDGHSGYVLMQSVNDKVRGIVEEAIEEHVQFVSPPGIMFYMWNEGSAINWHHDDHVDRACTIYLTDWPLDFGGQFIYKDDNGDNIVPIKANRMVVNDNHTEHKVTPVRKTKHIRYTLQVFGS